jgi:chondroitin sulfate synthase
LEINGWGMEDVQLCDSLLRAKISIFRAKEPALIHIFHEKICTGLVGAQLNQCENTRASHRMSLYGYTEKLKKYFGISEK